MNPRFIYGGRFMTVFQKITSVILLSVLWSALCIPVFTIGASSRAMYHAAEYGILHDEGYPIIEFFREFKKQFGKTFLTSIPFLVIFVLCVGNIYLFNHMAVSHTISIVMMVIMAIILILDCVWGAYLFGAMSIFDGDDKKTLLKLGYQLMISFPLKSLAVAGLMIITVAALYNFNYAIVAIPGIVAFLFTLILGGAYKAVADDDFWEEREKGFRATDERIQEERNIDQFGHK